MIYLMVWQDKDGLDLFEHYCNLIFISETIYKTIKNEFDIENDYKIKPDTNQFLTTGIIRLHWNKPYEK